MSLTTKLILGFSFALALQVVQMMASRHYTARMQDAVVTVTESADTYHAAEVAGSSVTELRSAVEVARLGRLADLHAIAEVCREEFEPRRELIAGFYNGLDPANEQRSSLRGPLRALGEEWTRVAERLAALEEEPTDPIELEEQLVFLDESLASVQEALNGVRIGVGNVMRRAVARERQIHDLPIRAGMVITALSALSLALFVWWFSGQLVRPIRKAHDELEQRVQERTHTLHETIVDLEREVAERKRVQEEREQLHRQLVDASRQAGMAEMATGVLHNVGNVLNSVNVSVNLLSEHVRASKVEGLGKATGLLAEHRDDLAAFLTENERGRMLPRYLEQLAQHLTDERSKLIDEVDELGQNVEHIKEIVSTQQNYARITGTRELVRVQDLFEDALRMQLPSGDQRSITVERQFDPLPPVLIDRARVMQILANLIRNARHAMPATIGGEHRLQLAAHRTGDTLTISVTDTGMGIKEEHLAKVFAHGFTTKKEGHGFGLHHSANSAAEMGGRLRVRSDGEGRGATFTLELPWMAPDPGEVGA